MSNIPEELKYAKTHEWLKSLDDGDVEVGITDHAQTELGDMVFVELPEVGQIFSAGDECAVVESVKSASDLYAPVSGEVTAVNEELADAPEILNQDSYEKGWIFRMTPTNEVELDELLDAETYAELIEE